MSKSEAALHTRKNNMSPTTIEVHERKSSSMMAESSGSPVESFSERLKKIRENRSGKNLSNRSPHSRTTSSLPKPSAVQRDVSGFSKTTIEPKESQDQITYEPVKPVSTSSYDTPPFTPSPITLSPNPLSKSSPESPSTPISLHTSPDPMPSSFHQEKLTVEQKSTKTERSSDSIDSLPPATHEIELESGDDFPPPPPVPDLPPPPEDIGEEASSQPTETYSKKLTSKVSFRTQRKREEWTRKSAELDSVLSDPLPLLIGGSSNIAKETIEGPVFTDELKQTEEAESFKNSSESLPSLPDSPPPAPPDSPPPTLPESLPPDIPTSSSPEMTTSLTVDPPTGILPLSSSIDVQNELSPDSVHDESPLLDIHTSPTSDSVQPPDVSSTLPNVPSPDISPTLPDVPPPEISSILHDGPPPDTLPDPSDGPSPDILPALPNVPPPDTLPAPPGGPPPDLSTLPISETFETTVPYVKDSQPSPMLTVPSRDKGPAGVQMRKARSKSTSPGYFQKRRSAFDALVSVEPSAKEKKEPKLSVGEQRSLAMQASRRAGADTTPVLKHWQVTLTQGGDIRASSTPNIANDGNKLVVNANDDDVGASASFRSALMGTNWNSGKEQLNSSSDQVRLRSSSMVSDLATPSKRESVENVRQSLPPDSELFQKVKVVSQGNPPSSPDLKFTPVSRRKWSSKKGNQKNPKKVTNNVLPSSSTGDIPHETGHSPLQQTSSLNSFNSSSESLDTSLKAKKLPKNFQKPRVTSPLAMTQVTQTAEPPISPTSVSSIEVEVTAAVTTSDPHTPFDQISYAKKLQVHSDEKMLRKRQSPGLLHSILTDLPSSLNNIADGYSSSSKEEMSVTPHQKDSLPKKLTAIRRRPVSEHLSRVQHLRQQSGVESPARPRSVILDSDILKVQYNRTDFMQEFVTCLIVTI